MLTDLHREPQVPEDEDERREGRGQRAMEAGQAGDQPETRGGEDGRASGVVRRDRWAGSLLLLPLAVPVRAPGLRVLRKVRMGGAGDAGGGGSWGNVSWVGLPPRPGGGGTVPGATGPVDLVPQRALLFRCRI